MIIKKNTAVFCLFVFSDENRLLIEVNLGQNTPETTQLVSA